jgi:hypothetical protein
MNPPNKQKPLPPPPRREGLIFSPLAWLKLQFFLHAGPTEIGGFGISGADDLLYIEEFRTLRQRVSAVTVEFDDLAVADHFDRCVDEGIEPQRCGRIWTHTHPGESPQPSHTDELTFQRVFGNCDWSLMFIIGRTDKTYARLAFSAGPAAEMLRPVCVDWESWPALVADPSFDPSALTQEWMDEYKTNVTSESPVHYSGVDLSGVDPRDVDLLADEFDWMDREWVERADQRAAMEVPL